MRRFDQRQGFLVSAVIHLSLLMMVIAHPPTARPVSSPDQALPEARERVFLPPNSVLRQLVPLLPKTTPPTAVQPTPAQPRPQPTPPPAGKDRMSVGPPSELRANGPMVLRREDDLTKVAKGATAAPRSATPPGAEPTPRAAVPTPQEARPTASASERTGREGLRVPPGLFGRQPSGEEGRRGALAGPTREGMSLDRAMRSAVDDVTRRLEGDARLGLPTGTGRDLGGLYFDPQGADFTLWVQRFKDEVYRNWIVPQSALWGAARGHVDFEFTVERSGAVASLRIVKSSGTTALDRAAHNALTSSRYLPLPDDYAPPRLTIQVTFFYGEGPKPS